MWTEITTDLNSGFGIGSNTYSMDKVHYLVSCFNVCGPTILHTQKRENKLNVLGYLLLACNCLDVQDVAWWFSKDCYDGFWILGNF